MTRKTNLAMLERRERLRLIETERREKVREEHRALQAHLDQTAELEAERDPAAVIERKGDRLRITSRDGIATLAQAGVLDDEQVEAALTYRKYWETMQASPRSNLNRDISGVGSEYADIRAWRAKRLSELERCAENNLQLHALRLIAGAGRTIRNIYPTGSQRTQATKALGVVLDAIARHEGLKQALDRRGPVMASNR